MKTIGVIGAGTMGSGIAQTMAQSGYEVIISEISQELADRGLAGIEKNLDKLVAKGRLSSDEKDAAGARITATCDIGALKAADMVIE
ncbi:MAG: NAD(P)-binding domain-containing protein, partial [Firmicutes bacterium]|nr:NAD(P)-binding domain-containing protein [Bacillota bacterium]